MVQVFATTVPSGGDPLAVCEELYRLLNVGDDPEFGEPDPRAVAYRARRNRSLSISDLVRVGGAWFACAANGFVPASSPRILTGPDAAVYGTAPYTGVDTVPATRSAAPSARSEWRGSLAQPRP